MISRYIGYATRMLSILATRAPYVRRLLLRRYLRLNQKSIHPFDVAYGISTSGFVPNFISDPRFNLKKIVTRETNHYGGCVPTCVRRALQTLPDTTAPFIFYDLGCGMGRALVAASEFPFQELVGIDLSQDLCMIAQANAKTVAAAYPDRAPIRIVQGDATRLEMRSDRIVVFLYHSFGRETLAPILESLEASARAGGDIFVIFENPVNGDLVDASPAFTRWHGEQVRCDAEELGHHADPDEAIVVWRSKSRHPSDAARSDPFDIVITKPTWRAEVVPRQVVLT